MKDKEKEIQSILNEYKMMRRKNKENEEIEDIEEQQEKSVINPELTLAQIRNLREKDLNLQMMKILIKKQEEIEQDEKKASNKIKKVKQEIGNFRYTYDENENATNADEMKKMTQKYERIRKEQAEIKGVKLLCDEQLSDFSEKTGLTVNNVKEMMIKEEELKRQYEEEQEKLRQERIEREERLKREAEERLKREIEEREKKEQEEKQVDIVDESIEQTVEIEETENKDEIIDNKPYDKDDIVIIYPYKNTASYIFEGKEGKVENIREIVWGEKPKLFGKFKIKKEEYVLTNNNTGETKEYESKLNPVVFEIFKSNPEKLENYMNLKSKTSILYVFDEQQKKNKDVAKIMNKYQKEDNQVSQKIGYLGFGDKLNAKFSHKSNKKISKKQLALPSGTENNSIINEAENLISNLEETKAKMEELKKLMNSENNQEN